MAKKAPQLVTADNFTYAVRRKVDSLHVSTPPAAVEELVTKAIDKATGPRGPYRMTAETRAEIIKRALARHENNRRLFSDVMGGVYLEAADLEAQLYGRR